MPATEQSGPAPAPYDFLAIGAHASGGFHLYVTDANGRKIAAVWGPAAEKEATARVFTAAPDLLAALTLVVSQIEDYERVNNLAPNPGRQHCWDSVAQAHAAIAKAEGRS